MYKELKLKANHNYKILAMIIHQVVIKCTKSWSWKQITTKQTTSQSICLLLSNVQRAEVESKSQHNWANHAIFYSCYQMYKELKLKANHNTYAPYLFLEKVVIKCTKSWSWKQITTGSKLHARAWCCYQMYKELKLKANHNTIVCIQSIRLVVIKCTKSWSWKQITTGGKVGIGTTTLLSNVQRAEVESKSQLQTSFNIKKLSCYQMYKELKLKANHNCTYRNISSNMLLSNVQRAEVESKSQPTLGKPLLRLRCYQMYKELKLKANHNFLEFHIILLAVVIKCTKSWSWKQITTAQEAHPLKTQLLSNVQRAEVESKSQPSAATGKYFVSCYQMYKELKLKANHNSAFKVNGLLRLLSNVQRAEVESKSQLYPAIETYSFCCYQMYKELKLKANHN